MKPHKKKKYVSQITALFVAAVLLSSCDGTPPISSEKLAYMHTDQDRYVEHAFSECTTRYCNYVMVLDKAMKERFK